MGFTFLSPARVDNIVYKHAQVTKMLRILSPSHVEYQLRQVKARYNVAQPLVSYDIYIYYIYLISLFYYLDILY